MLRSPSFNLSKIIQLSALIYMVIPLLIFLGGYLRWYLALPAILLLLFSLEQFWETLTELRKIIPLSLGKKLPLIVAVVFIVCWTIFSGCGSLGFQNGDYLKHNSILYDLYSKPWPVSYLFSADSSKIVTLAYGLAFYLPAALVGKLTHSLVMAHIFLWFWCFLGILLSILVLHLNIRRSFFYTTLFFMAFSGLDAFGVMLVRSNIFAGTEHIEWWSFFWQYSSNTTLLYWTPQHAIPGWILTGLLFYHFRFSIHSTYPLFLLLLGMLWSPFIVAGLAPFVGIGIFLQFTNAQTRREENKTNEINEANKKSGYLILITTFFIGFILLFFYLSRFKEIHHSWIWNSIDFWHHWPKLWLFYILEFGIFAFLLKRYWYDRDVIGYSYRLAILLLIILPLYKYGMMHDFMMRASIPSLFLLQMLLLHHLFKQQCKPLLLVIITVIMPLTALTEIGRSLKMPMQRMPSRVSIIENPAPYAQQYLGRGESFFFEYLCKKGEAIQTLPEDLKKILIDQV